MKMLDFLKNYLKTPSFSEMVKKELEEAHIEKLEAETAVEFAQSIVQYNTKRIDRLNTYMSNKEKAK
jgi:arsenate reductase-like glutaredoxin family protein